MSITPAMCFSEFYRFLFDQKYSEFGGRMIVVTESFYYNSPEVSQFGMAGVCGYDISSPVCIEKSLSVERKQLTADIVCQASGFAVAKTFGTLSKFYSKSKIEGFAKHINETLGGFVCGSYNTPACTWYSSTECSIQDILVVNCTNELPAKYTNITAVNMPHPKQLGSYITQGLVTVNLQLDNLVRERLDDSFSRRTVCATGITQSLGDQLCQQMSGPESRAVSISTHYEADYKAPTNYLMWTSISSLSCPTGLLEECAVNINDTTCSHDDTLVLSCIARPDKWLPRSVRLLSNPGGGDSKVRPWMKDGRVGGIVVMDIQLNNNITVTGTVAATPDLLKDRNTLDKICREAGYKLGKSVKLENIAMRVGNVTNPKAVLSAGGLIKHGLVKESLVHEIVCPTTGSTLARCEIIPKKCSIPGVWMEFNGGGEVMKLLEAGVPQIMDWKDPSSYGAGWYYNGSALYLVDSIGFPERGNYHPDTKSEDSINFGALKSEAGSAAEQMWTALLEQRKMLLEKKEELKSTLAQLDQHEDGIMRGSLECAPGSGVSIPTSYALQSDPVPYDRISRLELEHETQCKIINAAVRLAKEGGISKAVRKERLQAAQRAQTKMVEIERQLDASRKFKMPSSRGRSNSVGQKSLPERTETDSGIPSRASAATNHSSLGSLESRGSDYVTGYTPYSPKDIRYSPIDRSVYSPSLYSGGDRPIYSPPLLPERGFSPARSPDPGTYCSSAGSPDLRTMSPAVGRSISVPPAARQLTQSTATTFDPSHSFYRGQQSVNSSIIAHLM
eukprot:sb/3462244/